METERTHHRATKECAEWVRACVELGWPKDDMEHLEELWWQYNDGKNTLRVRHD